MLQKLRGQECEKSRKIMKHMGHFGRKSENSEIYKSFGYRAFYDYEKDKKVVTKIRI